MKDKVVAAVSLAAVYIGGPFDTRVSFRKPGIKVVA